MSADGKGLGAELTPWLRQGDVFLAVNEIPVFGPDGRPRLIETPGGVAVISQTCDVIRAASVQVAPIVRLSGSTLATAARSPRWAPLAALGDDVFVNLETVATIEKVLLREDGRLAGVRDHDGGRMLAQAIGRHYARFAFPDELNDWFRPLKEYANEKARKVASSSGRAFEAVRQIRVRSDNGWTTAPYELAVTFLLDVGEVPAFAEDAAPRQDLLDWAGEQDADAIARRLLECEAAEVPWLWQALGQAWVNRCVKRSPGGIVIGPEVEVVPADEYPLSLYWDSEALDLDHLSGPALTG